MAVTDDLPQQSTPRDLNRVDSADWPQRNFPISRSESVAVPVVVRQSVLNAIHRHGQSSNEVEVCGVLIGNGYRDEIGPFVYVEGSIQGEHAGSQLARVTFTSETWSHIQGELDRDYPHLRVVGWYHTHPGFGIFLSQMDMFIHDNFFNSPEQLALVYDPIRQEEGVFIWRDGVPIRERVLVESDAADADALPIKIASLPEATAAGIVADATALPQLTDLQRRQQLLTVAMVILAAIAILWPIGLQLLWPKLISPEPADMQTVSEPTESGAHSGETNQPSSRQLPVPTSSSLELNGNAKGELKSSTPTTIRADESKSSSAER